MKIKCPICKRILDNYTVHALAIHIHDHCKDEIADELAEKIFKIHEKIEDTETSIKNYDSVVEQYGETILPFTKHDLNIMLRELKSLLENEK